MPPLEPEDKYECNHFWIPIRIIAKHIYIRWVTRYELIARLYKTNKYFFVTEISGTRETFQSLYTEKSHFEEF